MGGADRRSLESGTGRGRARAKGGEQGSRRPGSRGGPSGSGAGECGLRVGVTGIRIAEGLGAPWASRHRFSLPTPLKKHLPCHHFSGGCSARAAPQNPCRLPTFWPFKGQHQAEEGSHLS